MYLRLFLFLGLVAHKTVWDVLKRGGAPQSRQRVQPTIIGKIFKLGKVAALVFLIVQTLFLDVLPIAQDATYLKIVGTAIYVVGLATAIAGRLQLGNNWANLEDYQVLPGQSVVSQGVYRLIRHPIYTGDFLLLVGLQLALNSWLVLGCVFALLVFVKNALSEESLLSRVLPGYEDYRKRTKRFVPFVV